MLRGSHPATLPQRAFEPILFRMIHPALHQGSHDDALVSPLALSFALALTALAAAQAAGHRPEESRVRAPSARTAEIYVTVIGEFDKDGDGAVMRRRGRQGRPVRHRPRRPQGARRLPAMAVRRRQGPRLAHRRARARPRSSPPPNAFPTPPLFLNDVAVDPESGTLYVSDSGDLKGNGGAVYRIDPQGQGRRAGHRRARSCPALQTPNGLALDGAVAPARRRLRHRRAAPRQARRRHAREARRRLRRRRRPGLGPLRPAVHQRLEGRQGLRHRPAGREAGAARRRASSRPPTSASTRPASRSSSPT